MRMTSLARLSSARAILLAVHLCASGDVTGLPRLQAVFPKSLPLERLLRMILTFLPESTEPQYYTSAIQRIIDGSGPDGDGDIDVSSVENVSEAEARKQLRRIRLLPLKYDDDDDNDDHDALDQFLIHRAHLIDSETGLQPLILELLLPFYGRSQIIRTWLISSLLPLLRLNYECCPDGGEEMLSVEALESMDNSSAVNVLSSVTSPRTELTRNLRALVGPWLYGSQRSKRRRLNETARRNSVVLQQDDEDDIGHSSGWQTVNEWLLSRYPVDRENVASAFATWNGPEDVDLGGYDDRDDDDDDDDGDHTATVPQILQMRYCQTGLAMIYANAESSKAALDDSIRILARVARLSNLEDSSVFFSAPATRSPSFDAEFISSCSASLLLQSALLLKSNSLTIPSASSVSFLSLLLMSVQVLSELGYHVPCRALANICLYANEDRQRLELESIISSVAKYAKPGCDWRRVRDQFLWLRNWRQDAGDDQQPVGGDYCGLFWRVPKDDMETEILKSLLAVRGEREERRKERLLAYS